jgi:hypothetical protein
LHDSGDVAKNFLSVVNLNQAPCPAPGSAFQVDHDMRHACDYWFFRAFPKPADYFREIDISRSRGRLPRRPSEPKMLKFELNGLFRFEMPASG